MSSWRNKQGWSSTQVISELGDFLRSKEILRSSLRSSSVNKTTKNGRDVLRKESVSSTSSSNGSVGSESTTNPGSSATSSGAVSSTSANSSGTESVTDDLSGSGSEGENSTLKNRRGETKGETKVAENSPTSLRKMDPILKPKMTYRRGDAADYILMGLLSCLACHLSYGNASYFTKFVDISVFTFMIPSFLSRFGTSVRISGVNSWGPDSKSKSKGSQVSSFLAYLSYWLEGIWMIILTRGDNCRWPWLKQFGICIGANVLLRIPFYIRNGLEIPNFAALSIFNVSSLVENSWSSSSIETPFLTRLSDAMVLGAQFPFQSPLHFLEGFILVVTFGLFYLSFTIVTVFRTISYLDHMRQQNWVFEFLNQTNWGKMLQFVPGKFPGRDLLNQSVALTHAFLTGVWTHICTVIPWFCWSHIWYESLVRFSNFVIANFGSYHFEKELSLSWAVSILTCILIVALMHGMTILGDKKHLTQFEDDELNTWYIKDHYLGHFCPFDFNLLHGPHHDCMPVGFIAVAGNGPLEGLLRHSFAGHPDVLMSPLFVAFLFTKMVIRDMFGHQYVPGCFPYSREVVNYGVHHVEHHFLSLYPLGNGMDTSNWKEIASDVGNLRETEDDTNENDTDRAGEEKEQSPKKNSNAFANSNNADVDEKKRWAAFVNSNEIEIKVFGYREDNKLWTWFCEQVRQREGF